MTLLIFLIVLSILIFVHEFGHFLVAKKFGIKVEEFALGFPPRIWAKRRGETTYSINAIPIGGFVRLYGEEEPPEKDRHRSFYYKPKKVRAAVAVAGVFMNFLLAVVAFWIIVWAQGWDVRITAVAENSPAHKAGVRPGDVIASVDSRPIRGMEPFKSTINSRAGQETELLVTRGEEEFTVKVTPREEPPEGEGALGVAISTVTPTEPPAWQKPAVSAWYGLQQAFFVAVETTVAVGGAIASVVGGTAPEGLAGPVGIYKVTEFAARFGIFSLISLVGLLSVNLAVLNIVPFPALDGGRLLFIIIEAFFGRRVVPAFERTIHMVGFALLIGLLILVTLSDVRKLLSGEFSLLLQP